MAGRSLISKLPSFSPSTLLAVRSISKSLLFPRASPLRRLCPLLAVGDFRRSPISVAAAGLRCFSTRPTTSSLNDPSPNWSNRPPKETILLDGCDFEHWLVVVEPPDPNWTREEIIDSYIKTLAEVVGSEEEARMKIYSVSTKHYFAFGALVPEELSYKIKTLPKVRWVLPDSYLDVKNKDYGGEPFVDGQAAPYDPKYHEEWVRNNARANERSRRNDRPRNNDRSRNFERRRENMQNFQNRDAPPLPNQGFQNSTQPRDMPPRDMPPTNAPPMPNRDFSTVPPPSAPGGPAGAYSNQMPNPQAGYAPNVGRSAPTGPPYPTSGPGYHGSNPGGGIPSGPGYQGGNPGGGIPGSPAYQGNGQGYQGGPPGYQGGNPNYQQGGSPNYQQGGGNPGYQQQVYNQPGPNYPPTRPSYPQGGPQGGPGGGGPSYPSPPGPTYQSPPGPSYQQGGPGGPDYQGRDVSGRD